MSHPFHTRTETYFDCHQSTNWCSCASNTTLYRGDQLIQTLITRFDVQIGHTIHGWSVQEQALEFATPAILARDCEIAAPKGSSNTPSRIKNVFCLRTVIVESVGCKTSDTMGQRLHSTTLNRTGKNQTCPSSQKRYPHNTLIAQNPIQLQWMSDGLMNLQHHLIWHQNQIHLATWTIWSL